MSQPTNHWKLGLFVVAGGMLALAALVYLGSASWRDKKVGYITYFDESVQGLETGSPVKFRGVVIGTVSGIDVAPDRRHVVVTSAFSLEKLGNQGLKTDGKTGIQVPADLRAQLASQGVTGLKYIEIDFFDVEQFPAPPLPFPVASERYIPAAVSTIKNLEQAANTVSDKVPAMLERADRILARLEEQDLPAQLGKTIANLDRLIVTVNGAIEGADVKGVSASLRLVAQRADKVLSRLDGDQGLLASVQRTSDGMGDLAALSPELGDEIIETLRDFRAASAALQRFAEALEQDPDMLIKGRRVSR